MKKIDINKTKIRKKTTFDTSWFDSRTSRNMDKHLRQLAISKAISWLSEFEDISIQLHGCVSIKLSDEIKRLRYKLKDELFLKEKKKIKKARGKK